MLARRIAPLASTVALVLACTSPDARPQTKRAQPESTQAEPAQPSEDPAIASMTEVELADLPAWADPKRLPDRSVARRVKLTITPRRVTVDSRYTVVTIEGTKLTRGDEVREVPTPTDRAEAVEGVMDGVLRGYLRRQGSRRVANRARKAQGKELLPEPTKMDADLGVDLRTPATMQLVRLCDIVPERAPLGTYSRWPSTTDLVARADDREVRIPLVLVRDGDGIVSLGPSATIAALVAAIAELTDKELQRRVHVKLTCE